MRTGNVLKRGRQSNCGCLASELKRGNRYAARHGHTSKVLPRRSPEYVSWSSMIQRCTDSGHASYPNYGAKGVRVCQDWLTSFERFLLDMGPRPPGHSIDRIDPLGNYEPSNCRWATNKAQQNNRSNSRVVVVDGARMTITQLAELAGIPPRTAFNRVNKLGRSDLSLAEIQQT